jgi:tetratricopeptide (TPR) repeat protein/ferredoxin
VIYRLWIGDPFEVTGVELTREGFWDTFPAWWPALFTFVLCGFVAVYFLGAKGFCTYACPYGAVFGLADRLSPGRIRVTEDCVQCGHCTATCTSNVDISREVHDYGMVVDPGCMKCMDCVSVCPENALHFGLGKPAILARKREDARPPKPRLPLVEEATAALAFTFGYFAIRGFYQERGFLLSVGIAAVFAFLVVTAVRLVRRRDVRFPGVVLKEGGKLRPIALVLGGGTLALSASAVPFGLVPEVNTWKANRAWVELEDARARWFEPGRAGLDEAELASAERLLESSRVIRARSGVRSLQNTMRLAWGSLFVGDIPGFEERLSEALLFGRAGVGLRTLAADQMRARGDLSRAEAAYRAVLAEVPEHVPAVVRLAELLGQSNRLEEARGVVDAGLLLSPDSPPLLSQRGTFRLIAGDPVGAVDDLRAALTLNPEFIEARVRLAELLAQSKGADEGRAVIEEGLALMPDAPPLIAQRGVLALIAGDANGAIEDLQRALALDPSLAAARDQLWRLLMELNRGAESARVIREGLLLDGAPVVLRAHLAQVLFMTGDRDGAAAEARRLAAEAGDNAALLQVAREVLRAAGFAAEADRLPVPAMR